MFYHIVVEIEKPGKRGAPQSQTAAEYDKTDLAEIQADIITPFLRNSQFTVDGYEIKASEVRRLSVKRSEVKIDEIVARINEEMGANVFISVSRGDAFENDRYCTDITKEAKRSLPTSPQLHTPAAAAANLDLTRVFIVHGHDDAAKLEAARFVEKFGLTAVILHEQHSGGKTIIEKLEAHANVGFAIILFTPDDMGGKAGDTANFKARARQNVVFEHGYFAGKLSRSRVVALVKGAVEKPTDLDGIVYVPMDAAGGWKLEVAKELRAAGYSIDLDKLA